jgi:hypothetical protein
VSKKLAVKVLTASDLTFFEWHFKNKNAGNQKALNLNADVFVTDLYPALPTTREGASGRLPIDLYLYGPGIAGEINLQRKIIKNVSYKNWRLDGEFIFNPTGEPDRFNSLRPGDFAILEFSGDVIPVAIRVVFVSMVTAEDQGLHTALAAWIGRRSMASLSEEVLHELAGSTGLVNDHPIREFLIDADLEDVVVGGAEGVARLLSRRSGSRISKRQLLEARDRADMVGELGEALVADYLELLRDRGEVEHFEWASRDNAISPFDFVVTAQGKEELVDVKSTTGAFDRKVHVSLSELLCMAREGKSYTLFRVFGISGDQAGLRVSADMRKFAEDALRVLGSLPDGVTVDSISVDPQILDCGKEVRLTASSEGPAEEDELLE